MDTKQGLSDLHDFLQASGPFRGTSDDLAAAMRKGASRYYSGVDVRVLLAIARSPEHVEDEGWTVPYVGRGNIYGPYAIADLDGDAVAMGVGIARRARNLLDDKKRTAAAAELWVQETDGRTEIGKVARYIASQEAATVANMEIMLARLDGAHV